MINFSEKRFHKLRQNEHSVEDNGFWTHPDASGNPLKELDITHLILLTSTYG